MLTVVPSQLEATDAGIRSAYSCYRRPARTADTTRRKWVNALAVLLAVSYIVVCSASSAGAQRQETRAAQTGLAARRAATVASQLAPTRTVAPPLPPLDIGMQQEAAERVRATAGAAASGELASDGLRSTQVPTPAAVADPCEGYSTCYSCTAAMGGDVCAFCSSSGQCIFRGLIPGSRRGRGDSSTVLQPASTTGGVPAGQATGTTAEQRSRRAVCPAASWHIHGDTCPKSTNTTSCAHATTCGDCSRVPGCGWCVNSQQCKPGDSVTSADGVCRGSDWVMGTCPRCLAYTCSECLANDCAWCESTPAIARDGPAWRCSTSASGSVCSDWRVDTCPNPDSDSMTYLLSAFLVPGITLVGCWAFVCYCRHQDRQASRDLWQSIADIPIDVSQGRFENPPAFGGCQTSVPGHRPINFAQDVDLEEGHDIPPEHAKTTKDASRLSMFHPPEEGPAREPSRGTYTGLGPVYAGPTLAAVAERLSLGVGESAMSPSTAADSLATYGHSSSVERDSLLGSSPGSVEYAP